MTTISRRHALLAAAALPLAPALAALPAAAAAPLQGSAAGAGFNRFRLGAFEVTALLAGTRTTDKPQETFGLNVSPEEFAAVSQAAFIPADKTQNFFTPVLVNTGSQLVLFDTGLAPEGITGALAAAGVTPDQIDLVVLTHMHGDHIGGLAGEAGPTFPNALYAAGQAEFDFWAGQANEGFDAKVRPLAEKMTFLKNDSQVAGGIYAIEAFGHSPGHMAFLLDSEDARLVLTADTANHYVWSLANPDWEVRFDADKPAAAATRRKLLGMIAEERLPFIGYHMPFPAMGYVETQGTGFRYVPVTYQTLLDG